MKRHPHPQSALKRALHLGFLIGVSAFVLVLGGCGRGSFSSTKSADPDTFRAPIYSNAVTLDPGLVQDTVTSGMLVDVYEGLVRYNANDLIEPSLAEKWEVKDGGKTYIFHIRHGVKFHNGRGLTADDFKWAIDRNSGPKFNSATASTYLNDIVGFEDRQAGRAATVRGVTVLDPYTLKIEIAAPKAFFLAKMTYPCSYPLPRESVPDREMRTPAEAVGTGPFKIVDFIPDQRIELARFDDYWGGKPPVKKIIRDVVKDAAVRLNKFRGGEVDFAEVDRRDLPVAQTEPQLKPFLVRRPAAGVNYVGLCGAAYKPFQNREVRRALAMAVNRTRIDRELLFGVPIATQILPPGIPGHEEQYGGIAYDPVAAKALLAHAGYPEAKGLPPLEMSYIDVTPEYKIIAESVALDLQTNLGINVSLRGMESRTFIKAVDEQKLGLFTSGWAADYLDPQDYLSLLLTSHSASNYVAYSNSDVDRLCAAADVEQDRAKRIALYRQAQDIAVQDAEWIPIDFQEFSYLVGSRVSGFTMNSMGPVLHDKVSLK